MDSKQLEIEQVEQQQNIEIEEDWVQYLEIAKMDTYEQLVQFYLQE